MATFFVDKSVEVIEKLRLQNFCSMLYGLGLTTKLAWQGTQYSLVISKGRWPWREKIQTLNRETHPSKPMLEQEWEEPRDFYTQYVLSKLYKGALDLVLNEKRISLSIDHQVEFAVKHFPDYLAYRLHIFPVQYLQEISDPPVFWVVSAKPLIDKDRQIAQSVWKGIDLRRADPEKYPQIYSYLPLFLERHFGPIRTAYTTVECDIECGDVTYIDSPEILD